MCCASSSAKKSPCWKAVTSKPLPSLACINQPKVVPFSSGPPSSNTTPVHNPRKRRYPNVGLLFVPYYSLYRDHISTLNYKWTYFLTTKITFFIWVFSHLYINRVISIFWRFGYCFNVSHGWNNFIKVRRASNWLLCIACSIVYCTRGELAGKLWCRTITALWSSSCILWKISGKLGCTAITVLWSACWMFWGSYYLRS